MPARLPAAAAAVCEGGGGGGGKCAAVLCIGSMDGLAEGAPLTVACLLACLSACLPASLRSSAYQPLSLQLSRLSPHSPSPSSAPPDSQSKPSRVSTESKRTSTSQQENLTSPIFWNQKHVSSLYVQSRDSLLYSLKQDPRQRSAVNSRNVRWYDQVLFPINLQEPNFPIRRCTAQRIAAIRYGHVAHVLQSRSCQDLNHHYCCLWPAAKLQSFSSRSLSRPTP